MREVTITYNREMKKRHDNHVVIYYEDVAEIENLVKIARRMRPNKIMVEIEGID